MDNSDRLDSSFDAYVLKTLKDWQRLGVIISVVKDGENVFCKGYGHRNIAKDSPDGDTLFHIASHSKPMAAASLAILVDEGKLQWYDPVVEYIPEFSFSDDYTSANIAIRDILSHRAGLPFLVGSLVEPDYSFEDLNTDLKAVKPVAGLRERHSYTNVGYAIAGEIVRRVSGEDWVRFVTRRLFKPLGMDSTYPTIHDLRKEKGDPNELENVFTSMIKVGLEYESHEWGIGINQTYAPAAGVVTTGYDIANWLIMNLSGGVYDGEHVISSKSIDEMHKSQTVVEPLRYKGVELDWNELHNPFGHFLTYGLGWFCYDYRDRKVDEHTGGGVNCSSIAVVPEENLGVAVCTNADSSDSGPDFLRDMRMAGALRMRIIDRFIDAPEKDWSSVFMNIHKKYA
ncbi:MAG: beta-lactamase family protein [Candidatus Bathyarchaeota archaeon]|nr:beta-lactamase family protein [Candidatus Bathyarchaeota archaeon]